MSNSESVKKWRETTKARIVESMGGKCAYCGYNECNDALALHHLDPSEKELSLGKARANPTSWPNIVKELKKCILLCHNCHSEVHAGYVQWPEIKNYFDESFTEYKEVRPQTYCKVCDKPKSFLATYCSNTCHRKDRPARADWSNLSEMKETMTNVQIAKILGVSENSGKKKIKKACRKFDLKATKSAEVR